MKEDDRNWPAPDRVGRQELEIVLGNEHISFTTTKLGSVNQVQSSSDADGLRIFYYLVQVCSSPARVDTSITFTTHKILQDLKCFVFSMISAHFKIQPIQR